MNPAHSELIYSPNISSICLRNTELNRSPRAPQLTPSKIDTFALQNFMCFVPFECEATDVWWSVSMYSIMLLQTYISFRVLILF